MAVKPKKCHGDAMSRIDPKFMLRLPADLRERVQNAAGQANQSMNSLIVSVLEREFPQPMINLHELSAFLVGVAGEWESGEDQSAYIKEVNRALATAKYPWTVQCEDGVVKFYPYADPDARAALLASQP